jgi:CBS domain-containing protein
VNGHHARGLVSELMRRDVHSVRLGDSLNKAAQIMWDHEIGCVPVLNGDGCLMGLVTDRDACMAAYTTGRTLHDLVVDGAMSKRVVACRAHDTLHAAEELMRAHQIRRLPVVDEGGRLIGLLSVGDLVAHFEPSYEGATRPLGGDAIAWTLSGASGGRRRSNATR